MDIAIISAPEDAQYAMTLRTELLAEGHSILDLDVTAGTPNEQEMLRALLARSHAIVVLLSPTAIAYPIIQQELGFLSDAALRTIPVYVVLLQEAAIPAILQNRAIFNLIGADPAEIASALSRQLFSSLREVLREEYESDAPTAASLLPPPQQDALPKPPPAPSRARSGELSTPPPPSAFGGAAASNAPAPSAPMAQPATETVDEQVSGILSRDDGSPRNRAATDVLQFSAYHPATLAVGEWQTLLVYAHIAAALAQVQADAGTFTELGSNPTTATGTATRAIKQGVELTIEPHMDGVTFSPASDAFIWRGDWHRSLFRCQAASDLAGKSQQGWIDIYAEGLVSIARIDLAFPFRSGEIRPMSVRPQGLVVTSNLHDQVFISYSHSDREAFEQASELYRQFGIQIYCDEQLAAGDDYERALATMIDAANVFHLLWSPHSAMSAECHKEWMHALQREPNARFIKPWFWKKPLVAPPAEFTQRHISFRYQHLKRKWWKPATW